MQYFHAKGIFQVDVGLHNLLVDWGDNVKYCDFSGSSIDGSRPTVVVSPAAQHPIGPPTVQTELFFLGSAIYEMSTAFKAYVGMEENELQARAGVAVIPTQETAAEIRDIQQKMEHGNDLSLFINGLVEGKRSEHTQVYIRMQLFIAAIVFST
ncbi:hypothetical protein MGYG_03380 [Nannizzia gypsea CBS 118893]|uniref:Protein kinase domain-containing protein n=1 Tax=Arthroderma gypseum (strain ATCC MYA-4604 / CBS 118893) TaxID=535722 RepID=E4UNC8_ARTGP|nr:hypothetical protein MGYG_03380 [Nannizzia gypsea CBS 118893]EFR00378.1 hypothetical protein MGYG_03380 [Nannizzia gypsea CBS 118893]